MEWRVDCQDFDIVKLFVIQYCAVNKSREDYCVEEEKNVTLSNRHLRQYRLTNLRPYTKYRVKLSMISTSGRVGRSALTFDTTKETGKA